MFDWWCACGFWRLGSSHSHGFGEFLHNFWADCGESQLWSAIFWVGWRGWFEFEFEFWNSSKRLLIWTSCSCGEWFWGIGWNMFAQGADHNLWWCMVVENIRFCPLSWVWKCPPAWVDCCRIPDLVLFCVSVRQECYKHASWINIPPRLSTLKLREDTVAAIPMRNGLILGDTKSYRTVYSPRPSSWLFLEVNYHLSCG